MHLWRSDYSPYIPWAQLAYCRRLIVVPLSTFHRLAEQIGDPDGQLFFLYYTARSGSTLLTQVVRPPQHYQQFTGYTINLPKMSFYGL